MFRRNEINITKVNKDSPSEKAGLKEKDMEEIASIIAAVLKNPEDKAVQEDVRKRVDALTAAYPLY